MRTVRIVLWALIIAIGVGATIFYLVAPPKSPIGTFGGPFELSRVDGGTFTRDDLVGASTMMFFGYTYCPDVCPTSLAQATFWRDEVLQAMPEDLQIVFVTVDPERDTPEQLKDYLASFGDVIGLYGTAEQTELVKKAFGVVAERVDDPAATDYLINHTASIFLLDNLGEFQGTIAYGESNDAAIGKLINLMRR